MTLGEYFSPVKIANFKSDINSDIEVVRFFGQYRLDMGGLTQSGEIIEKIWHKALKTLLLQDFLPTRILILGFGAGSAAKVMAKRWKGVNITAVELDSVVIELGKKYFQTGLIPNLKIINTEAASFVVKLKKTTKFDLTLVDCYQGYRIPAKLQQPAFIAKLKRHSGRVLINRLFWAEHKAPTLNFLGQLRTIYQVALCRTPSNIVLGI